MNKFLLTFYFFLPLIAHSQTADFKYNSANNLFCNPSVVQFTQSCSGNPSGFVWSFGNGTSSNQANPLITFPQAGTYKVRLIAIYEQNAVEITKTIVINPSITVSINSDRNYICKPGAINFTATSSGNIANYNWNFGDGSSLNGASNTISHNYLNFGDYNISLKATDVSGCFASATTAIKVHMPAINGSVSPLSGCIPANVSFNANVDIPAKCFVTNYAWNFNDGSPIISTATNSTTHVYNTTGKFSPSVSITTSEDCINNFTFDSLAFGTPPVNLVAYLFKTVICGSENAVVVAKAKNANIYYWDFGDGTKVRVTDTITQHKFGTLGIKTITVTPAFNECKGISTSFQINVIGVISHYDYSNTCSDKKTFSFTNTSQGNQSTILWDFGDGSPLLNSTNVTHTFPSSGSYVTSLTITDNITGCSDTYPQTIYTADPLMINPDLAICRNSNTTFSIANNYNNSNATYLWNIVGLPEQPSTTPTLTVKATIFGNFNNYVIINNGLEYCPDTIIENNKILVRGPIIDFNAPDTICFNSGYNMSNISKPYFATDIIRMWSWNFGGNGSDNNFQPQPYNFTSSGFFNVKLIGIDKNGCKDSLTKNVTVKESPFLRAIPAFDTLCAGQTATLIAFHNDKIMWSPANLVSCNNCDTVIANPSVTTKFYVTATNNLNCSSTDSVIIKVYTPFTATPEFRDLYICPNDSVELNIEPANKEIFWTPSTKLSFANRYAPIASPDQTTTYSAILKDSIGCFKDSADIVVHVKRAATVNAGPDNTYPYNSNFSFAPVYSDNVTQYEWTPSNYLSCNNCAVPNGVAAITTKYIVQVVSDSGCVAKDTVNIFVECDNANILMPNAFTPNSDGLNDFYFPLTRGIKTILRFSIYNRNGKLVYEAKNFPPNNRSFGWDGRLKDADQSTSVFVYYIEALCDVGEKIYRKGSVVLVR
jgi:gliding motility-associated-like protein